jgi:hypothetical protein
MRYLSDVLYRAASVSPPPAAVLETPITEKLDRSQRVKTARAIGDKGVLPPCKQFTVIRIAESNIGLSVEELPGPARVAVCGLSIERRIAPAKQRALSNCAKVYRLIETLSSRIGLPPVLKNTKLPQGQKFVCLSSAVDRGILENAAQTTPSMSARS